jgi:hypothetical protein
MKMVKANAPEEHKSPPANDLNKYVINKLYPLNCFPKLKSAGNWSRSGMIFAFSVKGGYRDFFV